MTVSKLPVHTPGTSATLGIRILATLNLPFNEVSVPIYVDVMGFAMGRAEVALTATSLTQPVPAATEQELLALLLARARANPR